MQCFVYRSLKKKGLYIYLPEKDNFSNVPTSVKAQLGDTEYALELEISPEKKLARENAQKVLENLQKNGFHIQMPTDIESILLALSNSMTKAKNKE